MRITVALGAFLPLPPAPGGAIERLWYDLGLEFSRLGHAVTFVARDHPGQSPGEVRDGVRYVRVRGYDRGRRLGGNLLKDLAYSARVLPALPPGDVLVVNAFWLPVLAGLRPSAGRVVASIQRMPKGQMWLYGRVARLAAVSGAVKEEIARQWPRGEAITRVIPNPVDTESFSPPSSPRPIAAGREKTLLYAGRLHPEKGLHVLIDAFRRVHGRFPELRLRLVGPWEVAQGGGGEAYLRVLRQKAGGLPVEFAGQISDRSKLAEAYRAADYFCYPSLAEKGESFGVAPLEAMATGLVPVVSSLACFRDFIEEGRTGYSFDHRDADAAARLAEVVERVVGDPMKSAEMGRAAAARAREFGTRRVAEMYLNDFEELLAGRRRTQ